MPTNCTPLGSAAAHTCCSAGASAMHGGHHEPHTLTTTTSPRWSAHVEALTVQGAPGEVDRILAVGRGHLRDGALPGDVALPGHRLPGVGRAAGQQPAGQHEHREPHAHRVHDSGGTSPGEPSASGSVHQAPATNFLPEATGAGSRSRAGSS